MLCGRLVCAHCRQAPERCPDPGPRRLTLPRGARLRAVDALGRYALVRTWRGTIQLFDLLRGEAVGGRAPAWGGSGPRQGVTVAGAAGPLVVRADVMWSNVYEGLRLWDPVSEPPQEPVCIPTDELQLELPHRLTLSETGRFAVVARADERAEVVDLVERRGVLTVTEPGRVIHSVALSESLGLLGLGSYGRVGLYAFPDGTARGALPMPESNVVELWLCAAHVTALTEHGDFVAVEALDPTDSVFVGAARPLSDYGPPRILERRELAGEVRRPFPVDVSPDGELMAHGGRKGLLELLRLPLHPRRDPVARNLQQLTLGDARADFVRFTAGARTLVVGAGRMVLRLPRSGPSVAELPEGPGARAVSLDVL
ncbi:MAG: hypothetical protein IT371_20755 [Deltaproteobacteria bacterium]|nr:hypothetical protein [Deltaproteobacteria bacterium]